MKSNQTLISFIHMITEVTLLPNYILNKMYMYMDKK